MARSIKQFARGDSREYKSGQLPALDWRTTEGRRFMQTMSTLIDDAGGADRVSGLKLQVLRRAAACAVLIEPMEAAALRGEPFDITAYALFTGILLKCARICGVDKIAREPMSLDDYLSSLQRKNGGGTDAAAENGGDNFVGANGDSE
jgi:hypothetical protein